MKRKQESLQCIKPIQVAENYKIAERSCEYGNEHSNITIGGDMLRGGKQVASQKGHYSTECGKSVPELNL